MRQPFNKLLSTKAATIGVMSARRPSWLARAVEALLRRTIEQALALQAERMHKHSDNPLAGVAVNRQSAAVMTNVTSNVAQAISSAVTQGIAVTVQIISGRLAQVIKENLWLRAGNGKAA